MTAARLKFLGANPFRRSVGSPKLDSSAVGISDGDT